MNLINPLSSFILLLLNLIMVAMPVTWNASAQQPKSPTSKKKDTSRDEIPELEILEGATLSPNRTPGGGLSSFQVSCSQKDIPIKALVPEKNAAVTISDQPSFLFYMPDRSPKVRSGEFILESEDGKQLVAQIKFRLPETAPGIVSITLPESAKGKLKIEEFYQWIFKLDCTDSEDSSPEMHIDGWILPIEATPVYEQLVGQADERIWYDTSIRVYRRILNNPTDNDARAQWLSLLKSIDSEDLSNIPLRGPVLLLDN